MSRFGDDYFAIAPRSVALILVAFVVVSFVGVRLLLTRRQDSRRQPVRCARADTAKPPGGGRAPSRSIATRRSEKTGIATSDASGMPSGRSTIRRWLRAMLARAATRRPKTDVRPATVSRSPPSDRPETRRLFSRQRGVDVRAAQRDASP